MPARGLTCDRVSFLHSVDGDCETSTFMSDDKTRLTPFDSRQRTNSGQKKSNNLFYAAKSVPLQQIYVDKNVINSNYSWIKMYRTKIKELINWKLDRYRKPLIVQGARQVGKTWLIKEFGKTEFKQTLYVNFEKENRLQDLFLLQTATGERYGQNRKKFSLLTKTIFPNILLTKLCRD
jgi:hypothetical protein